MIRVDSIQHLRELCAKGHTEFQIQWAGGLRSSKTITLVEDKFEVFSSIDGESNEYSEQELSEQTNIPKAITSRAFFATDEAPEKTTEEDFKENYV